MLELEISGVAVQGIHQNTEKRLFFSEGDFKAVLATFSCYDYGANGSETIDEDRYRSKRLLQILLLVLQFPAEAKHIKRLATRTPPA